MIDAETIEQRAMHTPPVVSPQAWEAERQQMLAKEKAFTHARDNLAAQRVYEAEEAQLQRAFADADAGAAIARNEYAAGTVDFTVVDTAQITALQAQRALVQMQANRLTTAVSLIEALGGGWTTAALPKS